MPDWLRLKRKPRPELDVPPSSAAADQMLSVVQDLEISSGFSQPEFIDAFRRLCQNIRPALHRNDKLFAAAYALREPEKLHEFQVKWVNEFGETVVNQGWRCEYSTILGPARGGIRLHPTVEVGIVKFLGLQQTIKNGLLNLPMGGAITASDFDARAASDQDLGAFADAFVKQLRKVMNPRTPLDTTPDLGCGVRECRAIRLAHDKLENPATRKPFPVAPARPTATGLGAVEFAKRFLRLPSFDKTRCIVSGCGDAALSVARNLIAEGAHVLTLSDSSGYIYVKAGLTFVQWQRIADHKKVQSSLKELVFDDGWLKDIVWFPGCVWRHQSGIRADYAFPCATHWEIDEMSARSIHQEYKVKAVLQVSSMPCTEGALDYLYRTIGKVSPDKATNCGAMAAIGLNLAENLPRSEFEHRIKTFMHFIHDQCKSLYQGDLKGENATFDCAVDVNAFLRIARGQQEKEDEFASSKL